MFQKKRYFFIFMTFCLYLISVASVFADNKPAAEYLEPVTDMQFVFVKGGCYEMGDIFGDGDIDELPVHEVCVDDFYMGKYEVTNIQFRKFILATGYKTNAENHGKGYGISSEGAEDRRLQKGICWKHPLWPSDKIVDKMDHPVVQVSWFDAQNFIRWLNRKTGKEFKLPTEEEWEYAARSGGKKQEYSWGDGEPSGNIADKSIKQFRKYKYWKIWEGYNDGYVYTSPVGKFRANDLGLYDMAGNVSEWCNDVYKENYLNIKRRDNHRGGQRNVERVIRGGSWNYKPHFLRCANRIPLFPNTWCYYLGFRLVMIP